MKLDIEKDGTSAESAVTFIAVTRHYGTPKYILVGADNQKLKFPGLRYCAARSENESLDDLAKGRFEEQTGLKVTENLGLRVIMPTRSRHRNQWIFRHICLGIVEDMSSRGETDIGRSVYLADLGRGIRNDYVEVFRAGDAGKITRIPWVTPDNRDVAKIATDMLSVFDWNNLETNWYRRIPCVGAEPLTTLEERPWGCGLAVASMILMYKPGIGEDFQVIHVKRKKDKLPGYAGGKIESPLEGDGTNVDPISCCMAEGEQELGFRVRPTGIICCAHTALDIPSGKNGDSHYVGIDNVAFVAAPVNLSHAEQALKNPGEYLEDKMECYVVESVAEFRERIDREELRMPDMAPVGREFFRTSPGEKIPLTQIRDSGAR